MSFDPAEFPLPRALSPSRLNDFQSCPRKYEYSAVRKLPQPASYASVKGRFVHAILEHLYQLPAPERTIEMAHSFIPLATDSELTADVRADLHYDEALEAKLLAETDAILRTYFDMEDPTSVTIVPYKDSDGVEIKMFADYEGAPLYGILDRLDRDDEGNLVIVDYKTGSVPRGDYISSAFANSAIYAVLCEQLLGEMPARIRLLYIATGDVLERSTKEVFPAARAQAAAKAWVNIKKAHEAGNFVPNPSPNNCRWCPADYKDRCRADGYPIPEPQRR